MSSANNEKSFSLAFELEHPQRSSRYIRTALDYLVKEKGEQSLNFLLAKVGIEKSSKLYSYISKDENWNSYLLEVTILQVWLELFDYNYNHFINWGFETASGKLDTPSFLWEFKYKIAPLKLILGSLLFNSQENDKISTYSIRHSLNSSSNENIAVISWKFSKLPAQFLRPYPGSILFFMGFLKGLMFKKGLWKGYGISLDLKKNPCLPSDYKSLGGISYILNDKAILRDELANSWDLNTDKILIDNTYYNSKNAFFVLKYPFESGVVKRLFASKNNNEDIDFNSIQEDINRESKNKIITLEKELVKRKLAKKEIDDKAQLVQADSFKCEESVWNAVHINLYSEKSSSYVFNTKNPEFSRFILWKDKSKNLNETAAIKNTFTNFQYSPAGIQETLENISKHLNSFLSNDAIPDFVIIQIDKKNRIFWKASGSFVLVYHSSKQNHSELLSCPSTDFSSTISHLKPIAKFKAGDKIILLPGLLLETQDKNNNLLNKESLLQYCQEFAPYPDKEFYSEIKNKLDSHFINKEELQYPALTIGLSPVWKEFVLLLKEGAMLKQKNMLDKCSDKWEFAYRLIPDYPDLLLQLGKLQSKLKQYQKVAFYLEKYLNFYPDDLKTMQNVILVNKILKNSGKALMWAEKLVMRDPENGEFFKLYLKLVNQYDGNKKAKELAAEYAKIYGKKREIAEYL